MHTQKELQEFLDSLKPWEREQWESGKADIWEWDGKFCLALLGTLELEDDDS